MDKEEFYRAVDAILGVDTYVTPLPYKKRWGQRNPGNGRYPGFGVVRYFGAKHVHIMCINRGITSVSNWDDPNSALVYIRDWKSRHMKKYLVKFGKNWADEFDVYGMKIIDEDEKARWHEAIAEHGDTPFEYSFGTNEGWGEEFEGESIEEVSSDYSFYEITADEASFLERVWGSKKFGIFPNIIKMVDWDA